MSDDRLRSLERAWRESGTAEDEARLVLERLRAGVVDPGAVEVAAGLGHVPSCIALGRTPPPDPAPGDEDATAACVKWLAPALERGPAVCARVAVAGARDGRYHWERFDGPEDRLLGGLDALDEWIGEPGPAAVERAQEAFRAIADGAQEPDGHWRDWGMANAILEALQVATEAPLAVEHARSAILQTLGCTDRPDLVFAAIRRELGEWLLGLSDPPAERSRVLGLRLGREPDNVRGVVFSPDGRRAASSSRAGTTTVWSVELRRRLLDLPRQPGEVFGLDFTPDGRLLTGTSRGALRLWEPATGEVLRVVEDAHPGGVRALAAVDDATAIVAGEDRRLVAWDLATGRPRAEHVDEPHERLVAALAVSPDGRQVALAVGPLVRLHDARDLRVVGTLEGAHGSDVEDVRFTPDGRRLLSAGGYDRSVKVWDLASRSVVTSFGDGRPVRALALDPAGRFAATGGEDELHLWSVDTGERLHTWRWPGVLLALAGSPTEPLFVSGSRSGALRLWRPEPSVLGARPGTGPT